MEKGLFLKVYNDKPLHTKIVNGISYINRVVLKSKTYKWEEISRSTRLLLNNNYFKQFKEYCTNVVQSDGIEKYEPVNVPIAHILKKNQLDVLKYIVEEVSLVLDYQFVTENNAYIPRTTLLNMAASMGTFDAVCYIDNQRSLILKRATHKKIVEWKYTESLSASPLSGDLEIVKYFVSKFNADQMKKKDFYLAIRGALSSAGSVGRKDIFEWLASYCPEESTVSVDGNYFFKLTSLRVLDSVIKGGNVEILKYCFAKENQTTSTDNLLDIATYYRSFEILKWLHENRIGGCTMFAMDSGAECLEILQWLHQNRTEGCTAHAMDNAACIGNIESLEFLHRNRTEGCTDQAMRMASQKNHFEIVKWLQENRCANQVGTFNSMDDAAWANNLEMVKWFHKNRTEGCTSNLMNYAAYQGNLEMVKWIHENRTEGCTTDAMDNAAVNGHLDIVKWLHENRTEGCTVYAMNAAAKNGFLDVVQWLHENRTEGCTDEAMDTSAGKGQIKSIKWLHDNRTEGCSIKSLNYAKENYLFRTADWLIENRSEFQSLKNKGKK